MAGVPKLFGGGLSSFVVFDQRLGSDDETATLDEQADRILYYFPSHLPLGEQLRHVGLLEGFIAFSRSLSHQRSGCDAVHLCKRRYIFSEPEPDIWVVALVVNPEIAATPSTQFSASTDPALSDQPHRYDASAVDDSTLRELVEGVYRVYTTFYGSIGRVLRHANSVAVVSRIAGLRAQLRRLAHKAAAKAANAAHAALTASACAAPAGTDGERPAALVASDPSQRLRALIAALEAVSPVAAVRATLRGTLDFLIYYTDWSNVLPLDGTLPLRSHKTPPRVAGTLESMVSALISRVPCLSRGAILVDGQLVAGRMDVALAAVHHFLRLWVFHAQVGTYVSAAPEGLASADSRGSSSASLGQRTKGVFPVRVEPPGSGGGATPTEPGSRTAPAQPGSEQADAAAWSTASSVLSVSRWLAAVQGGLLAALPVGLCVGQDAGTASFAAGSGTSEEDGARPVPVAQQGGFHRVAKPAALAAAPFATTSTRGVHTVRLDAGHVLAVPYVSQAYLESLALLQEEGQATLREESFAATPAAAPRCSTGCVGPRLPPPRGATASAAVDARKGPVDSLRAQLEPHLRKAAEATTGMPRLPASSTVGPPAGEDAARVFVPAVFALGPDSAAPSHRLVWAQNGLVTVLCLLDAASLQQRSLPDTAPPPDSGRGDGATGSSGGNSDADINPERLAAAVAALQDICLRSAAVEAAVLGSLDATAMATQGVTGDGTRAVFWQRGPRVVDSYGLRGIARRSRGGSVGPQAVPVSSAYVAGEIPRHLLIAWNLARRDALSNAIRVEPGGSSGSSPPRGQPAPSERAGLPRIPHDDRLPQLLALATDRRAPLLSIAGAVRRRAASAAIDDARGQATAPSLIPSQAMPSLRLPTSGSVQLATRYDGAVAAVSRDRAQQVTFAFSLDRTPDPPAWVLAKAHELHRGYYSDATQVLHQRH